MDTFRKLVADYLDDAAKSAVSMGSVLRHIKDSRYVCVFGAGMTSQVIVRMLREKAGIDVDFLCDNDPKKWGATYHGRIPCKSPRELEAYRGEVSIVIASKYYREIRAQLQSRDFDRVYFIGDYRLKNDDFFASDGSSDIIRRNALDLAGILGDEQSKEVLFEILQSWFDFTTAPERFARICTDDEYYPEGIIRLGDDEAFVDGGAFNGDSLLGFIAKTAARFEAIHAFELDENNFTLLQRTVAGVDAGLRGRIELYRVGLLDREGTVFYQSGTNEGESSAIVAGGGAGRTGKVVRLSDVLSGRKVTYIKYDLEGSDLKALRGATEIIRLQKPKLAICVYHEVEHLWEIPKFIKETAPGYSVYLRHHSALEYGTVCYAVHES